MAVPYGFWASVLPLYPARHRRTYELIQLVVRLAKYAEMNFKNAFSVLRPHELSPQVQPMIPTPNHGSFPSGHATEAHAVARVLFELASTAGLAKLPPQPPPAPAVVQLREQLMRQAARIAINRTVAGMHYPVDSMAGQALGLAIGEYFIARCQPTNVAAANLPSVTFDGTAPAYAGTRTSPAARSTTRLPALTQPQPSTPEEPMWRYPALSC